QDPEVKLRAGKFWLAKRGAVDGIVDQVGLGNQKWVARAYQLVVQRTDQNQALNIVPLDLVQIRQAHLLEVQPDYQPLMRGLVAGVPHSIAEAPLAEDQIGRTENISGLLWVIDFVSRLLIEQDLKVRRMLAMIDKRPKEPEIVPGEQYSFLG